MTDLREGDVVYVRADIVQIFGDDAEVRIAMTGDGRSGVRTFVPRKAIIAEPTNPDRTVPAAIAVHA